MPSFDIVSEVNKVELKNAVDQANKEIANRFDFKGSDARVEQAELVLTIYADDDFKLKQVTDVLLTKCAKRAVDARMFDTKSVERIVVAMGTPPSRVLHTSTGDDGHPGWRSLPDLLATSDIVSLHLPLTDATAGMLDRAALARMKPDAVLVNTSRGAVVDEHALVDALRARTLAAAGLDVFAVEPIPAGNPLLGLDNVVLTPHVTWYTADTMRRYLEHAVDNCRRLRDGRELANKVN